MIRPAATDTDKEIFNQLVQKISAVDTYFCCGGALELVDRPLTLFYKSKSPAECNCLGFRDFSEKSSAERQTVLDKLLRACDPAPHGNGEETVLDESYRLARELRQDEFALSIDVLSEVGSGILSSISALTAGRLSLSKSQDPDQHQPNDKRKRKKRDLNVQDLSVPNLAIIPRSYKLNAYAKGGFFKPHRDTPKGSDHIGTLMLALPIAHQGGILRVKHDGKEIFFDWSQQCSQGIQVSKEGEMKISIPWAFLFSDVEHEVFPVESGTRITVAFDIFQVGMSVGTPMPAMDGAATPFYNDLVNALRNPLFLPNGANVAIALSHSYPAARRETELTGEEFALGLKGVDAIVYRALKAAGFDVSLRAVMKHEDLDNPYRRHQPVKVSSPDDGYDESYYVTYGHAHGPKETLVTSNIFRNSDCDISIEDYEVYQILQQHFGAEPSHDVMWVKKPKNTFVGTGSYLAYSNEHSMGFLYAAAAFILQVPPFGEGSRAFE